MGNREKRRRSHVYNTAAPIGTNANNNAYFWFASSNICNEGVLKLPLGSAENEHLWVKNCGSVDCRRIWDSSLSHHTIIDSMKWTLWTHIIICLPVLGFAIRMETTHFKSCLLRVFIRRRCNAAQSYVKPNRFCDNQFEINCDLSHWGKEGREGGRERREEREGMKKREKRMRIPCRVCNDD